jgi:microcystin-dependent protein
MEPFLGQIIQVGFSFAPLYWSTCSGQALPISQNTALFSLLGTTFGGDGVSTFQLPNLQGRVMVGAGTSAGGTVYLPGQTGGAETVTLTAGQMPTHTHTATFSSTGSSLSGQGVLDAVQTAATGASPSAGAQFAVASDARNAANPQIYVPAGTSGSQVALGGLNVTVTGSVNGNVTVAPAGSGQPFSALPPYLAVTTIIAISGVFPSRG